MMNLNEMVENLNVDALTIEEIDILSEAAWELFREDIIVLPYKKQQKAFRYALDVNCYFFHLVQETMSAEKELEDYLTNR